MKVIVLRQPFAWLVAAGVQQVISANRFSKYRGPVLIYASRKRPSYPDWFPAGVYTCFGVRLPPQPSLPTGGVVGYAEIVDFVGALDVEQVHPFAFASTGGYLVRNARPLPFHACERRRDLLDPPAPYPIPVNAGSRP